MRTPLALALPLVAVLAFPAAAGAAEHNVDTKLYNGGPTSAQVAVDVAAGSLVEVYTSDSYTERVGVEQLHEQVYVYGVGADGSSTLLGLTPDLADLVESASTSAAWTAPASFTGLRFVLHEDQSSPNSLHVRMATVAPAPEPVPAPTIPEPTIPEPAPAYPTPEAPVITVDCASEAYPVVSIEWRGEPVFRSRAIDGVDPGVSRFPAWDDARILATATFDTADGRVDVSDTAQVDCPPSVPLSPAPTVATAPASDPAPETLPVTGASTVALVGMVAGGSALILGGSMLTRWANRR